MNDSKKNNVERVTSSNDPQVEGATSLLWLTPAGLFNTITSSSYVLGVSSFFSGVSNFFISRFNYLFSSSNSSAVQSQNEKSGYLSGSTAMLQVNFKHDAVGSPTKADIETCYAGDIIPKLKSRHEQEESKGVSVSSVAQLKC